MPLELCILETDDIHPNLQAPFHSYGKMFSGLFEHQPIAANCQVFSVLHGQYPDPEQTFDAYLITGSKADAFGEEAWIQTLKTFVQQRYAAGDKLLGICFGHQLLAHSLGGLTTRSEKGWGLGVQSYQLSEQPNWMQPAVPELKLQASHQDQVQQLPKDAERVAHSAFCANAAFRIGNQVLCFQGHPEFTEGYAQALLDMRRQTLGESLYHSASQSLKNEEHHGRLVGQWMLNFIHQA